jgi:branched-chain amino acid transport system permease protein
MRLLHFAQGDLLMFGGFIALSLIGTGVDNLFLVLPLVFIVMAAFGALIERSSYSLIPQQRMAPLIICTLGVGLALRNLAVLIWGTTARGLPDHFFPGGPLTIGEFVIQPVYYWTLCLGVSMVLGLVFFLYRTKNGLAMRLTAFHHDLAEIMGVHSGKYQTLAFVLAAGITGVAGVLVSPISFVHYNMGLSFGVKGFAAAIIGGLDSLPGALLGGLILGLAEVFFGKYLSAYVDVLAFSVMILVLVFKPHGLLGKTSTEKI